MQKEKEIKKPKISDFILPISFLVISLILLVWFKVADGLFEKIIAGGIFVMVVVPFYFKMFSFQLAGALKPKVQYQIDKKGNITPRKDSSSYNNYNNNYKDNKGGKSRSSYRKPEIDNENYRSLRNCLIVSSKNKQLTREDILTIKSEVNNLLGSHQSVYDDFTFANDMMEIYTKIKSSKMNDIKWKRLLILMDNIGNEVRKGGKDSI